MRSARYRFFLGAPLATSSARPALPLMFDGILGYAWAVKRGVVKNPGEILPENLVFPVLPVDLIAPRCYAASALFLPELAVSEPTLINRHASLQKESGRHGLHSWKQNLSGRWSKACQEVYWLTATPYVDFYVRGDIEKIDELVGVIGDIGYIGAKRSAGYGLITDIRVEEDVADWSTWKDGKPTRPLPVATVGEKEGLEKVWAAYYPPYWSMAGAEWCYMPPLEQYQPSNFVPTVVDMKLRLEADLKKFNDARKSLEEAGNKNKEERRA